MPSGSQAQVEVQRLRDQIAQMQVSTVEQITQLKAEVASREAEVQRKYEDLQLQLKAEAVAREAEATAREAKAAAREAEQKAQRTSTTTSEYEEDVSTVAKSAILNYCMNIFNILTFNIIHVLDNLNRGYLYLKIIGVNRRRSHTTSAEPLGFLPNYFLVALLDP
ncbi:uncharacterized protein LOC128033856 [Gossypium raimondii]|uniref:uncharacterized protein LOC128033856 n=1 Tax=Gossypium raimondii TaxID=29730 RepID=UPI00227A9452|nr:uncharacterized protein LOC128033856 [Gossypium raimondii]